MSSRHRQSTKQSPRRWGRIALAAAIVGAALVGIQPASNSRAAAGSISGRMFVDGGADGLFNGSDVGVGGQTVRAFDSTGTEVGSAVTETRDGTYTLSVSSSATETVRIEFPTPVGYQSSFTTSETQGSGTSIQFAKMGATNVDYGIFVPADYCQATRSLASVCINQGARSVRTTERSIGLTSFEPATTLKNSQLVAADQTSAAITNIALKADTGATWGLGWQSTTKLLWNSAVIRRHSALGPKGLGGLYVYDLAGTSVASFDLVADKGLVLEDPSDALSDGVADYSDAARDIVAASDAQRSYDFLSRDKAGYEAVGMAGLGDLDISYDGAYMWITNLYERKIHRIALGGTAAAPTLGTVESWAVDNGHTCTKPVLRPWGLDTNPDGTIMVAAVCTNEAASPANKELPGEAVILKLDPTKPNDATAWTKLTEVVFDQPHNYDYCTNAPFTCTWKSWTNDWTALQSVAKSGAQYWWTQPMILDIEQLSDASFVLGVSDRMSYQLGANNYEPVANGVSPNWATGWTAGDTLLLCKTAEGWAKEASGKCAGLNNYENAHSSSDEFFYDSFGHPETTIGGLALGRGQVAVGAMDPAAYYLGGVRWVSTYNGRQTNALNMTPVTLNSSDPGFGKSASMGDLEALCDAAPLQIGNRVWYDDDRDGVQDPEEDPVVGVTVRLYDASGTLVGTAITSAEGEYYFSSNVTEAANGGATPDAFGGGLAINTVYTVVLDNPDDCAAGKPLDGFVLTYNDKTTTAGPAERDDLIDSDAVASGVPWCGDKAAAVTVSAMSVGGVNHSYDIGFWKAGRDQATSEAVASGTMTPSTSTPAAKTSEASAIKVSVGDYVWWDLDRDGIQDAGDIPIRGVVLTITKADGSAVTDVNGRIVTTTVTDTNGRYSFDDLPPGQYTVKVTPPINARSTKASAGKNVSKDSSTGSATSIILSTDGQRDPTLDFGFYKPSVSVGNFVWRDMLGDGFQNKGDPGLAGFKVLIRNLEGEPVADVYGRPVRAIRTKSDGKYLFTELPPGRYEVQITYPRGWMPTTANRSNRALNSSTYTAVSKLLKAGEADLTLDFGVVSRPGEQYQLLPATR